MRRFRWNRRQTYAFGLAVLLLLLVSACELPGQSAAEEAKRYVTQMREPLARFSGWLGDLKELYGNADKGDLMATACTTGRLESLVAEGAAAVADMKAVQPPKAVASIHNEVVAKGSGLVEKLRQVKTLLCESGDTAAARRALDEVGTATDELGGWLQKLSPWLKGG